MSELNTLWFSLAGGLLLAMLIPIWKTTLGWMRLHATFDSVSGSSLAIKQSANGLLCFDDESSFSPASTVLNTEGIVVVKLKLRLSRQYSFLIPWANIESVYIWKPESLDRCESIADVTQLSQELEADISVKRGKIRSVKIPWNYAFNKVVPPNVRVTMNWKWPYPPTQQW